MTTTTSVLPAFLNAIQTALDAEAALDGVNVLSGPAGPLELGIEYVALAIGEIGLAQSWGAQETRYKKEDYSIPCELHARTAGAGEAAIRAARARAFALLAVVEDVLRTALSPPGPPFGIAAIDACQVEDVRFGQGFVDNERTATVQFDITARTSLISA